jgi:hypothetical protein
MAMVERSGQVVGGALEAACRLANLRSARHCCHCLARERAFGASAPPRRRHFSARARRPTLRETLLPRPSMRTFRSHHLVIATAALLVAAPASAQRPAGHASTPADPAPTARIIPARCDDSACRGDYQLAIVAALYPYDDGTLRGPGVLTLVIENRGPAAAPLATLDVAPVARFAVARHTPVAALLPGERTVVEIPVTVGADGSVPCLAISVGPSISPASAQAQVYAAAAPEPAAPPAGRMSFAPPPFAPPPFVSFVDEGF